MAMLGRSPKNMSSTYQVKLNGDTIAETLLETADPPMGVVSGKLNFSITECPYSFFKKYCEAHSVTVNQTEEEFGLIDTQNIKGLKVFNPEGVEITDVSGSSICGFQDDGYEITILGVPYPFYEEEFPDHVDAYDKKFSESP